MSNKTTECYAAVFQFIEQEIFKLEPTEFMSDFEAGLRKAIANVYPNAKIRGCWFHYCKALRQKGHSLVVQTTRSQNAIAKMIMKEFMSLPLLPPGKFVEGFSQILTSIQENGLSKEFKKFVKYFNNFWMKQVGKKFRKIFK